MTALDTTAFSEQRARAELEDSWPGLLHVFAGGMLAIYRVWYLV